MGSDDLYFSERQGAAPPRDRESLGEAFWGGFVSIVQARLADGSFAEDFPINCFEAPFPVTCDTDSIGRLLVAENPRMGWPLNPNAVPDTVDAIDGIEFFAKHVSKVRDRSHHSYGRHDHFHTFDRAAGRSQFTADVNTLFRRGSHPYQLEADGAAKRLGLPILRKALEGISFDTGDSELDHLLSVARERFSDPDPKIRAEGLEKLWDAWERLKTKFPGDKKASVTRLLDRTATEPAFRAKLEEEATALTRIGNEFMIRHTETGKPRIERSEHVDYLFHRLFALVGMILRVDRGAPA